MNYLWLHRHIMHAQRAFEAQARQSVQTGANYMLCAKLSICETLGSSCSYTGKSSLQHCLCSACLWNQHRKLQQ